MTDPAQPRVGYCWWLLAMALAILAALIALWFAGLADEDCGRTFCCREHSGKDTQL
jgi:hypothetical protein